MSHFSFTRNNSDDCALVQKLQESTGPFMYQTDSLVHESKEKCYLGASPFQHNPYRSIPVDSIDIESDLRGQTRILSKCSAQQWNPSMAKKVEPKLKDCVDQKLVPQYTRLNKPCNIFSGISINRFDPLYEDIQDDRKIQSNSYIGVNTRLQIKDAFQNK
jgi:hypothetical protein